MGLLLKSTRYVILVPILGLALASALCFVLGGLGLIRLVFHTILQAVGVVHVEPGAEQSLVLVEVIEYVHTFLVGTVLYITAIGLYQLFIREIAFVGWLKVESTDELETNLVGVTVVVLAVNFMGAAFTQNTASLLQYGAGIALPIAALGLFIGLRAWAARQARIGGGTPREHPTHQARQHHDA
jgi:uncharacterized membrane protein YqhA